MRRGLPSGWPVVKVSQGDTRVNSEIVPVDSVGYVMFDVVPDAGEVTIDPIVTPEGESEYYQAELVE